MIPLLWTSLAYGALSFCGSLDLSRMENREIFTLILLETGPSARVQCGLPKETLPICSSCEANPSEEIMRHLRPVLSEPAHRAWHADWHKIRRNPPTPEEFREYQRQGVIPSDARREEFLAAHRVGRTGAGEDGGTLAGEDFFYMHRLMLKMNQVELAAAHLPCIAPWTDLPTSVRDPNWPAPKLWQSAGQEAAAEAELLLLRNRLAKLRDPTNITRASLNDFGLRVEAGLHQSLHEFYRSQPRCSPEALDQGVCDDLLPPESSLLNKYFPKIHGLVDELLGAWLEAHGMEEIARNCEGRPHCYEWRGTWVGKYPVATEQP